MTYQHIKNPMDYLGRTPTQAPQRNPYRYEVIYYNRYQSRVVLPHHLLGAAERDCDRIREMGLGYKPIINDTSTQAEELVNA